MTDDGNGVEWPQGGDWGYYDETTDTMIPLKIPVLGVHDVDSLPYALVGHQTPQQNPFNTRVVKSHRKPHRSWRKALGDFLDPRRTVPKAYAPDHWYDDVADLPWKVYDAAVDGASSQVWLDTGLKDWAVAWREPQTMTLEAKNVALETMEVLTGMFFDGAGEDPPIYATLKQETEDREWSELAVANADDDKALAAYYRRLSTSTLAWRRDEQCGCSAKGPCYDHR